MSNIVVGSQDGQPPVYSPQGRFQIYALDEVFQGTVGTGKYVPNVGDYVIDRTTNEEYSVVSLDITTLIPVLKLIQPVAPGTDIGANDLLQGVGPGSTADTYRIYIDQSVIPHTLAVDARLRIYGTSASYAKIFQSSEVGADGTSIAAFYDASGNMLGDTVPLELCDMPGDQNYAVKTVSVAYTMQDLVDNEIVTVVIYAADGGVVSKQQLIVENTAFIRTTDASQKYITGIQMVGPFMSTSNPNLLQYPLNLNKSGLNLMGQVNYSDGSAIKLPIDGTKFQLFGFDNYVATIVGQQIPLVLKYNLSNTEYVYNSTANANGTDRFISLQMMATTLIQDGAYTVKLFCVPIWVDETNGYRLEWWMLSLDRTYFFNVTPYVTYGTTAFNPIGYGIVQNLQVNVTLNQVNPAFKNWIHTQTLSLTLNRKGTDETGTNWTIVYSPGQNPSYGTDMHASVQFVNQNLKYVDVSLGETDIDVWLNRMYLASQPLTDTATESAPPTPNMFSFIFDDGDVEYPISQWTGTKQIANLMNDGDTLRIKFFYRTPTNDQVLAVCPLPIWFNGGSS